MSSPEVRLESRDRKELFSLDPKTRTRGETAVSLPISASVTGEIGGVQGVREDPTGVSPGTDDRVVR